LQEFDKLQETVYESNSFWEDWWFMFKWKICCRGGDIHIIIWKGCVSTLGLFQEWEEYSACSLV